MPLWHGCKVDVGTVSIAALYERVLARDLDSLDIAAAVRAWRSWDEVEKRVREAFAGTPLEDASVAETRAKYTDAAGLARRLELLADRWGETRDRVRKQILAAEQVRAQLERADCPSSPVDIGLDLDRFKRSYRRAQMIRRRYTILDFANEAGILDECVEELFADRGFWATQLGATRGR
ncbi:MAG: hypothetical protein JO079_15215 [Frankiaceae bacterium]|nr:hypothetical protein [Frankiaceae bacterium]